MEDLIVINQTFGFLFRIVAADGVVLAKLTKTEN